jgi:hypothetical protein
VVGLALLVLQFVRPPANVQLDYAPDGAKAVLDGVTVVHNGKFRVNPGQHTISITLGGFTDATEKFTVPASGTKSLALLLNPNSVEGYMYLGNHPSEEAHREKLGGQKFSELGTKTSDKLPLVKDLPFIDQLYRIDYGPSKVHPDDQSAVAIYITYYSDTGKQQALQWIKFKGYDPSALEIIYQHD